MKISFGNKHVSDFKDNTIKVTGVFAWFLYVKLIIALGVTIFEIMKLIT